MGCHTRSSALGPARARVVPRDRSEGRAADLVVLDGNPAAKIEDVEKLETVFKDGVGYDPVKLRASVAGMVGIR